VSKDKTQFIVANCGDIPVGVFPRFIEICLGTERLFPEAIGSRDAMGFSLRFA
jgi:hypothetical protein